MSEVIDEIKQLAEICSRSLILECDDAEMLCDSLQTKVSQLETNLKIAKADTRLWKKRTHEAADAVERFEQLEAENNKLLDTCLAAGFIGNGTQIIGDKRYEELVAAEKEFKRFSVAFVNSEEKESKLKKHIEQQQKKIERLEDLLNLQELAGNWANETFGKSQTVTGVINHLIKEVCELRDSNKPDEAADCLLLLFQHAHELGYDLLEEARKKHEINLKRKWREPDEHGVIEHVRASS